MRTSESEAESVGVCTEKGLGFFLLKFAGNGQDHYDNVISVEMIHQGTMGDVAWQIPKDNGLQIVMNIRLRLNTRAHLRRYQYYGKLVVIVSMMIWSRRMLT